jgi:hypothetical protein
MVTAIQAVRTLVVCTALILAGCGGSDASMEEVGVAIGGAMQLKAGRTVQVTPTVQHEKPDFQYRWQQVSGPALQLSSTTTKQVQLTAPALTSDALAVLALTVTTASGKKATDSVQITLKANQLPLVSVNQVLLQEKSQAVLSITAQDADGTVTHIDWLQVAGPTLEFVATNSAQLAVKTPAIGKVEFARFLISVTDDDGDTTVVEHSFKLEPIWQEYNIGGFLAAKEMGGAEVIAQVNSELFRTNADANGSYTLTLKLDDDASDDYVLLRANSTNKAGMELWLALPSLRQKVSGEPVSATPYSTAILALATRLNNGVVPAGRELFAQLETAIKSSEAGEMALMVAAYAEQNQVGLPLGQPTLFHTVYNRDSYVKYRDALMATVPELLSTLENKLPQQGWGKIDISAQQLMLGLRLESDSAEAYAGVAVKYYQFAGDSQAQVADEHLSYSGNWSLLMGSALTHGATTTMPLYQLSVDNPDLGLTAEQVMALKQEGHTTLDVKITLLGEQLSQVSRGVYRHLFLRQSRMGYQVQPLMLDGQWLEFPEQEVEIEAYAWGTELYQRTLPITEQMLLGQWLKVPVYRHSTVLDQSKLQLQEVVFSQHGEGYSISSGENFSWSIVGQPGSTAVLLEFASGYRQLLRLNVQMTTGFSGDIYVTDSNGKWLAAQYSSLFRLWGV